MLRKLLIPVLVGLVSSAFAVGTYGQGVARDASGRHAQFGFQAAFSSSNTTPSGNFLMRFISPTTSMTGPEIHIPQVTFLRVEGNRASFAGRGFVRVRTNTGEVRDIPAHVMVDVEDNMVPSNPSNTRDRIRVRAMTPLAVIGPTFDGFVIQGDIVVTP